MKKQVLNDAIVKFDDALRWAEPLMKENPDIVIKRVLAIEPAVFGVAANIAKRTCERIEGRGISRAQGEYVFRQVCLAGAIAVELMKNGNALLFDDLLDEQPKPEGRNAAMSEPIKPAGKKRVSAFALAKTDYSVHARIGIDDVKALRPDWNEREVQAFLREHGDAIGTEMAMAGAALLAALIGGNGQDVN